MPPAPDYSDVQIKLERTTCFGYCPAYSVTLYADGRVVYEGKSQVRVNGIHEKKIPMQRIQEIVRQAEFIDYFSLPQSTPRVPDVPLAITDIRIGNRQNQVKHYLTGWRFGDPAPSGLTAMEEMIDQAADIKDWTNCRGLRVIPEPCMK